MRYMYAIVNDIGSFSELPDDACIKLPSVEKMSPEEKCNSFEALIGKPVFGLIPA